MGSMSFAETAKLFPSSYVTRDAVHRCVAYAIERVRDVYLFTVDKALRLKTWIGHDCRQPCWDARMAYKVDTCWSKHVHALILSCAIDIPRLECCNKPMHDFMAENLTLCHQLESPAHTSGLIEEK